jgi:hypothetical protein
MWLALAGLFALLVPAGASAQSTQNNSIVGVWLCTVIRSGTLARPIIYTFHPDGTMTYNSGTTVDNTTNPASPTYQSGFTSRGGGWGEWTHEPSGSFHYQSVEFLLSNGNLAGYFNVDSSFTMLSNGQLCAGRAECPDMKQWATLARYTFGPPSPDGPVVDQEVLIQSTPVNSLCNRITSGLGFPAPIPPLAPALPQ